MPIRSACIQQFSDQLSLLYGPPFCMHGQCCQETFQSVAKLLYRRVIHHDNVIPLGNIYIFVLFYEKYRYFIGKNVEMAMIVIAICIQNDGPCLREDLT